MTEVTSGNPPGQLKTYTQNRAGESLSLELPFKVLDGYTRSGKKKYLHFAPSLNEIILKSKRHKVWYSYKKKAENQLIWEIKSQTKKHFDVPVAVTFQRHAVTLLDWDNMGASFKLIGDALRKAGVIKDDDTEHIKKFYPEQYKVKHYNDEKIILKIWEYKS